MGWWSRTKKKVKETYTKIDKKVGGVLPGGYVKPKPKPTPKPEQKMSIREPTKTKSSFKETMSIREPTKTKSSFKETMSKPTSFEKATSSGRAAPKMSIKPEQRPITQEEVEAGLSQTNIDEGMSLNSVGTISPITTSDIMALWGISGAIKTGISAISGRFAGQAVKSGISTTSNLYKSTPMVHKEGGVWVANNVKTQQLAGKVLLKKFSAKALALMGGAGAWASSITIGKWGQAEGPEAINFAMNKAMSLAEESGDWSIYDEAKEARDELLDLSAWEEIMLWSPASAFKGIPMKIEGGITQGIIMDKIADDKKIQQESGETDDDKWARVRQEQADQDRANIDYYNSERKKLLAWEREAKKDARNEDAKFWRKEKEAQRKKEAEDREAIAKFWETYRKMMQKMSEDSRPSNLNFGLI